MIARPHKTTDNQFEHMLVKKLTQLFLKQVSPHQLRTPPSPPTTYFPAYMTFICQDNTMCTECTGLKDSISSQCPKWSCHNWVCVTPFAYVSWEWQPSLWQSKMMPAKMQIETDSICQVILTRNFDRQASTHCQWSEHIMWIRNQWWKQRRRKMFLIRGADLLNVLRKAQMLRMIV